MKDKIFVENKSDHLHFYLKNSKCGKLYLFSQRFSRGVFDFFSKERSINEILNFRRWNRNPRLDKTISKIPIYMRYAEREYGYCLA